MESLPLISVIITTYKRKPTLIKKCIISALNQTYTNLEITIVDDSPIDYHYRKHVKKFIESFQDTRLKYVKHTENKGANAARNTGIKLSRGEYIAFLDDDDEWELNKLELQLEKIMDKDFGLVYCKGRIYNECGKYIKPINNELIAGHIFHELIHKNFIGGNSFVLVSRNALDKVGYYDESLLSNQDWELFLRISLEFEITYVDEFLVKYYIHTGESITSSPEKKIQGWDYLYEKYDNYLKINKDVKNSWDLKMIINYINNRDFFRAIQLTIKSFLYSPKLFWEFMINVFKAKTNRI